MMECIYCGNEHCDGSCEPAVRAEAWALQNKFSLNKQIRVLAASIAQTAEAIADDTLTGPLYSAIQLMQNNLDTLAAYVGDDRGKR